MITFLKQYEAQMGYDGRPVGMTMQFPVADQTRVNDPLFASPADWISPGYDDEIFAHGAHPMEPGNPPSRWFADPPAADGRKVVLSDTDHYAPGMGDALWVWKSFVRGHHPILMDFGIIGGVTPAEPASRSPGTPPYEMFEPARFALGDTLRFAQRMDLVAMEPRGDLSSTGLALANPGAEYLILHPSETAEAFTVELAPGVYQGEWYNVNRRETRDVGVLSVKSLAPVRFRVPPGRTGPVVLYLRQAR